MRYELSELDLTADEPDIAIAPADTLAAAAVDSGDRIADGFVDIIDESEANASRNPDEGITVPATCPAGSAQPYESPGDYDSPAEAVVPRTFQIGTLGPAILPQEQYEPDTAQQFKETLHDTGEVDVVDKIAAVQPDAPAADPDMNTEEMGKDIPTPREEQVSAQLRQLTVLHEQKPQPDDWSPGAPKNASIYERTIGGNVGLPMGIQPQRGEDQIPANIVEDDESRARSEELQNVCGIITKGVNDTELTDTGEMDWRTAALDMLDTAAASDEESVRDQQLMGALVTTRFSDDPAARIAFIRRVYDHGMASTAARLCRNSSLSVIVDEQDMGKWGYDIKVEPITKHADLFAIERDRLERYLAHVAGDKPTVSTASPNELRRRILAEIQTGTLSTETQTEAADASLNGPGVHGVLLDPHKIERYALQELFIADQLEALFGTTKNDLLDSPLSQALQYDGQPDFPAPEIIDYDGVPRSPVSLLLTYCQQLSNRVTEAISHLSYPLTKQYSLAEVDISNPDSLTARQRASHLYQKLGVYLEQYDALARFISFEALDERAEQELIGRESGNGLLKDMKPENFLWQTALGGSLAPRTAVDMLYAVLREAIQQDEPIEPEVLYRETQAARRGALSAAGHNERESAQSGQVIEEARVTLPKSAEDKELSVNVITNVQPMGACPEYAAVTAGCPALKPTHATRHTTEGSERLSTEERLLYGGANIIDHIIAATLAEAYRIGMFDLNRYVSEAWKEQQLRESAQ